MAFSFDFSPLLNPVAGALKSGSTAGAKIDLSDTAHANKVESSIAGHIDATGKANPTSGIFPKYHSSLERANLEGHFDIATDKFSKNALYDKVKLLLEQEGWSKDLISEFEESAKTPRGLTRFMDKNKKALERTSDKFFREFGKVEEKHVKALGTLLEEFTEAKAKLAEDAAKAIEANPALKDNIIHNRDVLSKRLDKVFETQKGYHQAAKDEIGYLFKELEEVGIKRPAKSVIAEAAKTAENATAHEAGTAEKAAGSKAWPAVGVGAGVLLAGSGISDIASGDPERQGAWAWIKTAAGAILGGMSGKALLERMQPAISHARIP